ncbi:MAG: alpha-hydroxy-acid oxidizing protein [Caldilineaceae bacterium]
MSIDQRKADHIRINLEENVTFPTLTTGLEKFRFIHQALPELNLSEVDSSLQLFGKRLQSPLLVSSMTGGTSEAERINRNLAAAAEAYGVAIGVGSQRAGIEQATVAATFRVREEAPTALLFANCRGGPIKLRLRR